jgi:hypothetical protein
VESSSTAWRNAPPSGQTRGTGYTKREVLGIMKSAYDARSAIAHGGTPGPEVMKVRGQRVSLQELAKAAKSVIAAGRRAALAKAASHDGGWPPDWDGCRKLVPLGRMHR